MFVHADADGGRDGTLVRVTDPAVDGDRGGDIGASRPRACRRGRPRGCPRRTSTRRALGRSRRHPNESRRRRAGPPTRIAPGHVEVEAGYQPGLRDGWNSCAGAELEVGLEAIALGLVADAQLDLDVGDHVVRCREAELDAPHPFGARRQLLPCDHGTSGATRRRRRSRADPTACRARPAAARPPPPGSPAWRRARRRSSSTTLPTRRRSRSSTRGRRSRACAG